MPKIMSLEELGQLKDELLAKRAQDASRGVTHVTVGMGTCGIAAGAREVLGALQAEIEASHANDIVITQIGCVGLCAHEPIVEVVVGSAPKVAYGKVDPDMAKRIVRDHVLGGKALEEFVIDSALFPAI
jgi:NADP-reducing hydrogenase subunit HndB